MNRLSTPQRAAVLAAAHSTWITALAILGGLISNWAATGQHGSLLDYVRANAVGWVTAQLIAPGVRAYLAQYNAKLGVKATPDVPTPTA